jgi:putative transcriptional regulator
MPTEGAAMNLTHHFLIAMPGLQDASFARSVVYLCEHSPRGALGLVINKPTDINLGNLFAKVDLPLGRDDLARTPVLQGGPVQTERGFVLHEAGHAEGAVAGEPVFPSTLTIPGGLEMTTSKDVLEAIATGAGPRKLLVTLGYSAWGEGQLESELAENSWLTVDADPRVIFDTPIEERWSAAAGLVGIDPLRLPGYAGHA